jgi:hypothetical protein
MHPRRSANSLRFGGNAGRLREIQAMRASIAKSARSRRMLNCRSSKTKTRFQ